MDDGGEDVVYKYMNKNLTLVMGRENAARIAISFATGSQKERLIAEFYAAHPHRDRQMDEIMKKLSEQISKARRCSWEKREDYEFDGETWLMDDDRLNALEARAFRLLAKLRNLLDTIPPSH